MNPVCVFFFYSCWSFWQKPPKNSAATHWVPAAQNRKEQQEPFQTAQTQMVKNVFIQNNYPLKYDKILLLKFRFEEPMSCFVLPVGFGLWMKTLQPPTEWCYFSLCLSHVTCFGQLCIIAVHVFVSHERKNNYCWENTKSTITHRIHAMSLLFVSFAVD